MNIPPRFGGLNKVPKDPRTFSTHRVFGTLSKTDLPTGDFFVSDPLEIKNQGHTDFCAGYAAAAVLEDHEDVELNGEYIFQKAKVLDGKDSYLEWGSSLLSIARAVVKFGALEQTFFPF